MFCEIQARAQGPIRDYLCTACQPKKTAVSSSKAPWAQLLYDQAFAAEGAHWQQRRTSADGLKPINKLLKIAPRR